MAFTALNDERFSLSTDVYAPPAFNEVAPDNQDHEEDDPNRRLEHAEFE